MTLQGNDYDRAGRGQLSASERDDLPEPDLGKDDPPGEIMDDPYKVVMLLAGDAFTIDPAAEGKTFEKGMLFAYYNPTAAILLIRRLRERHSPGTLKAVDTFIEKVRRHADS